MGIPAWIELHPKTVTVTTPHAAISKSKLGFRLLKRNEYVALVWKKPLETSFSNLCLKKPNMSRECNVNTTLGSEERWLPFTNFLTGSWELYSCEKLAMVPPSSQVYLPVSLHRTTLPWLSWGRNWQKTTSISSLRSPNGYTSFIRYFYFAIELVILVFKDQMLLLFLFLQV